MKNPLLFLLVFNVMSSTALVLNVFVSTISFTSYFRAGHFRPKLLVPFLITSIPASFLGGMFELSEQTYAVLLYVVLTYLALRMTFFPVLSDKADWTPRPVPLWAALTSGTVIGLLSGMIGIGGGIFLSPLIILLGWGNSKQAAASAEPLLPSIRSAAWSEASPTARSRLANLGSRCWS